MYTIQELDSSAQVSKRPKRKKKKKKAAKPVNEDLAPAASDEVRTVLCSVGSTLNHWGSSLG